MVSCAYHEDAKSMIREAHFFMLADNTLQEKYLIQYILFPA